MDDTRSTDDSSGLPGDPERPTEDSGGAAPDQPPLHQEQPEARSDPVDAAGGAAEADDDAPARRSVTGVRRSEIAGVQRLSRRDGLVADAEVRVRATLDLRSAAGVATSTLTLVTKLQRTAAPTARRAR